MTQRTRRRVVVLGLVCSLLPSCAFAQAILSYEFQVYQPWVNPATGAPFQTQTIPASAFVCNQPPPTFSGTQVNPRTVYIDDLAVSGRMCRVDQNVFLLALPVLTTGNYVATITATDAAGTSGRSAASNPFVRTNPPAAPVGLRVGP